MCRMSGGHCASLTVFCVSLIHLLSLLLPHRFIAADINMQVEKFTVPPGAYVRSADYYWSFNEFVDSGTNEIFQNTGEYSYGMFNASASLIQQNNDSILNGSTWYTLKFDKLRKQCITIPGFENVNHSCIINPNDCSDGLSMEVWLKMQNSDFNSDETQTIIAADAGFGGFFVYQVGRKMTVLVANGSFSWHVEKNLPNAIQAGDWFNLAFRWRIDKGVQLFINSELQEEIPFAVPMEEAQTPADNKMYVGCRNHELTLKDFADYEMDELALWNKYMPDHKIIDFTGAIIPSTDIELTIFKYQREVEQIELGKPSEVNMNPYYEAADFYEPCHVNNPSLTHAIVNTTRGLQYGIKLSLLEVPELQLDQSSGLTKMEDGEGVAFGFWVLPNMASDVTLNLLRGSNWAIGISEGNITVTVTYQTRTINETWIERQTVSQVIRMDIWSNIGVSWKYSVGLELYVNGKAAMKTAIVETEEVPSMISNPDELTLLVSMENVTISDIIIWRRYLYSFEAYRFIGMSPSEAYLNEHADMYWSTDYWVSLDMAATETRLPLYQTLNSSVTATPKANAESQANKGKAMKVSSRNGWVMLGLIDTKGEVSESTGSEFAGTCLSDPSLCNNGLTLGFWLNIVDLPENRKIYSILTSGEEDLLSRGFSITMQDKNINITIVDGVNYWKVSVVDGVYPVNKWMHLAFSWSVDEGLWVFIDGELLAANKEPVYQSRPYDRYSRITLGRDNANNVFGGFIGFSFQEIAVYFQFTVTYRIREIFTLVDNSQYEKANVYYNKDSLITGAISELLYAKENNLLLGPMGNVMAFNNTISLGPGAIIVLDYLSSSSCIVDPSECTEGITVSVWTRNNRLMEVEEDPVYLLSSHQKPEEIRLGATRGWTIYYIEDKFMVTLVSDKVYSTGISELAKKLKAERWTNIAFTWSSSTGVTIILDSQVAGILKNGEISTASGVSGNPSLLVGHPENGNSTNIGIFNVAIWEKYYFGSRGYELTGHREEVVSKYSAADLMWSFDGPIHLINAKFDEMVLRKEIYDSSLTGAALEVTRDGLYNASLGNYSSECITEPSSCKSGFQLGAQLKLAPYVAGEGADNIGSILLLGSPDANFEGLAIQMIEEDGGNQVVILVTNNEYAWRRAFASPLDEWFELVIGWNVQDGIAAKINNKKVSGAQQRTLLKYGSSKLVTNNIILGVGSGGGTNQGVDAEYNDIYVIYSSNVPEEQEGRCYDTTALYYRLDKGQIFTMEEVIYAKDRQSLPDSGFLLKDQAYVELDQFVDHCFSDPSLCPEGLSLSLHIKVEGLVATTDTLLSSGYPLRGYRLQISESASDPGSVELTVAINDGSKTWQTAAEFTKKTWTSIGFTWNKTEETGLSLYIDGELREKVIAPTAAPMDPKTTRQSLVIGRSNHDSDIDFCNAIFDDVAIWDYDVTRDFTESADIGNRLLGLNCESDDDLLVEAEIADILIATTMNITEVDTRPPGCTFYDASSGLCATDIGEFVDAASNVTGVKVNNIPEVLIEMNDQTSIFMLNSTEPTEEFLYGYVDMLGGLNSLPMDTEVDPRDAQVCIDSIISSVANMFEAKIWKDKWSKKNENSTKGSPYVMKEIEELSLKFTSNLLIGLDKEDDCTSFKSANPGILMSSEKRRMFLCDRDYVYPRYDKLEETDLVGWDTPTDTVMIPPSAWPKEEFEDDAIVSVSVLLYDEADSVLPTTMSLGTFVDLDATTSADNPDDVIDTDLVLQATVNSRVMSITVNPFVKPPLLDCLVITMEHTEVNTESKRTPYCAFWDHTNEEAVGGTWSAEGCEVTSSNETHTVCCCYHMTSFAVMMEPLFIPPVDTTLQTKAYLLYICTGISTVSLLIFCFVIICNKSLRSERNMVHLNLCISMILATASYLAVHFVKEDPVFCKATAIAQHYLFMVAYAWILVEALCLFYAVLYGQLMGNMKCYAPLAWLIPVGVVTLCLILYSDKYGLNERCWLTYNEYLIMAMLGPIFFFIFLDVMALLIIICNLPQPTLKKEDILSEVRWAVFYALLLVPYLIFTWLLPMLEVMKVELTPTFDYIFIAAFSLQGFFCFLVFGLGQRSVRMGFMRKKYQPAYGSSALLGRGSSRSSSAKSDPLFVPVKPQPMSRPSSRSSKDKASPKPQLSETRVTPIERRPSTSSSEDEGGYIP